MPTSSRTRRPLTKERVLEKAIAIADKDGIEALSMRPTGMCSKTGHVPSWVGAAGTPVFPGEVRTTLPLCHSVISCGTFR